MHSAYCILISIQYTLYSRAPQVFGTLARKDSVLVKLFIFLTRKDRIIRLS